MRLLYKTADHILTIDVYSVAYNRRMIYIDKIVVITEILL